VPNSVDPDEVLVRDNVDGPSLYSQYDKLLIILGSIQELIPLVFFSVSEKSKCISIASSIGQFDYDIYNLGTIHFFFLKKHSLILYLVIPFLKPAKVRTLPNY
jgi:hypothetical protein